MRKLYLCSVLFGFLCGCSYVGAQNDKLVIECGPPAKNLGNSPPGRVVGRSILMNVAPGGEDRQCLKLPAGKLLEANCYSLNSKQELERYGSGYKCEGMVPCGNGARFSVIEVGSLSSGNNSLGEACVSFYNPASNRFSKTALVHFSIKP